MADLYYINQGQEKIVATGIQIEDAGLLESFELGTLLSASSEKTFWVLTAHAWDVDEGDEYYIVDGDQRIGVDPLEVGTSPAPSSALHRIKMTRSRPRG